MALLTLKLVTDLKNPHYEIVEFHGELDPSSLPGLEKELAPILESYDRQALIFDLSQLKFTNSEGIGFLVTSHMKLAKRKHQLFIAAPRPNVRDVLELVGIPRLIPVYDTLADAIGAVSEM